MIKYIKGDLFTADVNVIAHGTNCVGGFGSGIAGRIARDYPHVKEDYLDIYNKWGHELGWVNYVRIGPSKYIANCNTQYNYLPRGVCHVDYKAIEECMYVLHLDCKKLNRTIAIPKIGAGLGGGDWDKIEKIINKVFDDMEILCYTLD